MKKIYKSMSTAALHAGYKLDDQNAHLTPIYQTSTYVLNSAEEAEQAFASTNPDSRLYSRFSSPNQEECEEKLSTLETFGLDIEAKAILHSSGMAAISTLMHATLQANDTLLTQLNLYGGTASYFDQLLMRSGIKQLKNRFTDLDEIESLLKQDKSIKLIYLESPDNPLSRCVDIACICELAQKYNILTAVDNTVATPFLQQPFQFGIDFIIHSGTKYLNGQGTNTSGVLIGRDIEFIKKVKKSTFRILGANLSAIDTYILNNGIRTLPLRMERHITNTFSVVQFLQKETKVLRIYHSYFEEHPDVRIAKKQMKGPHACFSFEIDGGKKAAFMFLDNLKLCVHAVSLGTCDTLVCHPGSTTHKVMNEEQRKKIGITDNLIRISVGLEGINDIQEDITQALSYI